MTIFSSSSLQNLFSLTLHVDLYGLWSREVAYVITYKEKVRAEESSKLVPLQNSSSSSIAMLCNNYSYFWITLPFTSEWMFVFVEAPLRAVARVIEKLR